MSEFNNTTVILNALNYANLTYNNNDGYNKKIKIFCGNVLPSGYYWCDGHNNTPDLRDFFIYASPVTSTTLGNIGSNNPTMPAHNHSININSTSLSGSSISTATPSAINNVVNNELETVIHTNHGATKADDGTQYANKSHHHNVTNKAQTTTISINSVSNVSETKNYTYNLTNVSGLSGFNTTNQTATTGDLIDTNNAVLTQTDFNNKYISVGYIMKITT